MRVLQLFSLIILLVCLNLVSRDAKSQSIVIVEPNVSSEPIMLRVAGNASLGYIDRIVESPALTENDTVKVEIFFDWCALSGVFMVYDTTFTLESSFPFNLCVTTYRDTLAFESPCENYSLAIDTFFTACLSADQILSDKGYLDKSRVNVYPNPTSERLNIDLTAFQKIPSSYVIRDLSGRTLSEGRLREEVERIDVSRLPAGLLILEIDTDSGILRQRFVKMR